MYWLLPESQGGEAVVSCEVDKEIRRLAGCFGGVVNKKERKKREPRDGGGRAGRANCEGN